MRMPLDLSWLRPLLANTFHVLNTKMSVAEACQTIRSCYTSLKNLASAMVSSCNVSTRNNVMPFFPEYHFKYIKNYFEPAGTVTCPSVPRRTSFSTCQSGSDCLMTQLSDTYNQKDRHGNNKKRIEASFSIEKTGRRAEEYRTYLC